MRLISVLAIVISISACSTTYVTPEVTCPQPLTLPKISAVEMESLSDDTYRKLDLRDTMLRERVKTLREMFCK